MAYPVFMDCRAATNKNPDVWMENLSDISRPLCETVREWICTWEPELAEAIKWNMLCYSGQKLVCALGGYKKRAGLVFFRATEIPEAAALCNSGEGNVSIMSVNFTSVDQLDRGLLRRVLRAAVRLDESVPPPPPVRGRIRPMPEMPPLLAAALKKNKAARAFFESLKPTYQREYMIWVGIAKRPETQAKRLEETINGLVNGRKWAHRLA